MPRGRVSSVLCQVEETTSKKPVGQIPQFFAACISCTQYACETAG